MSDRFDVSALDVGHEFAGVSIDVSATTIIGGALATHDYSPVHHDTSVARDHGLPNVLMNILTTNGLVERFVMESLDYGGRIQRIQLALGVPVFPGDVLTFEGSVVERSEGMVRIAFTGANSSGNHVTGVAEVGFDE